MNASRHSAPSACPNPEELSAFAAGKLPADDLEAVAAHLDTCAHCATFLDRLADTPDPLLAELRQPLVAEEWEPTETPRVEALVERIASHPEASTHEPSPPSEEPTLLAEGDRLGQYQLLDQLGQGGMGRVFRAHHRLMNRIVAVKIIHRRRLADAGEVRRFQREIRALARLNHPHIVRAEYADQVGDHHFLVMEYVEGRNLGQLIRQEGPLPVARACGLIRQAAAALEHARQLGLVHRDIKPSNLMVTPEGTLKILDLGLALLHEEQPANEEITASGQVMGTVDYMAPEQWDNPHQVDIRADLYSLGCTLYFLLTGRPPFGTPKIGSVLRKMKSHAEAPVPPIQQHRPEVPDTLAAVIDKLLAKDPRQRFATPAELEQALRPFTAEENLPAPGMVASAPAQEADRPATGDLRRRPARRLPRAVAAVLLLGGAAVGWWLSPYSPRARQPEAGPQAPPPLNGPAGPVVNADKPRLLSWHARHFQAGTLLDLGDLGVASWVARFDDWVRLRVRLSAPAYCYLIAFNPNGQDQLLYPDQDSVAPAATDDVSGPSGGRYFRLNDDVGLQAFVLLASGTPLPPYRQWQALTGKTPWAKRVSAEGIWQFDGRTFQPLVARARGDVEERAGLAEYVAALGCCPGAGLAGVPWGPLHASSPAGPPQALTYLCRFFKGRPEVDLVAALAFPVKPRREGKEPVPSAPRE